MINFEISVLGSEWPFLGKLGLEKKKVVSKSSRSKKRIIHFLIYNTLY